MALALSLALAGCTGEGAATPTTTPTVSPSTSPTPTPSPTPETPQPPMRPEAMATNDEAGAVAAAQYFITDLYDYMFASGDVTEWSALSDDGCNFCNSILGLVDEMNAAGETEKSDPTAIESVEYSTLIDDNRYGVTLVAQQGDSARIDSAGNVVETSSGTRYSINFAIAWTGGWSILAVDAIPVEGTR